jgi:ATP-dependent DNA helicase RecQ
MWPAGMGDRKGRIAAPQQAVDGRALARGSDPGWGDVVRRLLADGADPADPEVAAALDQAIEGLTRVLARWGWAQRPTWVTWIPSRRRPWLVEGIAQRIGDLGRMPSIPAFAPSSASRQPQAAMGNSVHAAQNAVAAVRLDPDAVVSAPLGPVLLVDDVRTSGWTLTVAAAELGRAGAGPVMPLVLQRSY